MTHCALWHCRLWKGLVPLWGRQIPYTMMKFGKTSLSSYMHSTSFKLGRCTACSITTCLTVYIAYSRAYQHVRWSTSCCFSDKTRFYNVIHGQEYNLHAASGMLKLKMLRSEPSYAWRV